MMKAPIKDTARILQDKDMWWGFKKAGAENIPQMMTVPIIPGKKNAFIRTLYEKGKVLEEQKKREEEMKKRLEEIRRLEEYYMSYMHDEEQVPIIILAGKLFFNTKFV